MRRKTVHNHKCQRQRGARDCRVTRSSRTELHRTKARFGPHRATEADSSGLGRAGQQNLPTFPAPLRHSSESWNCSSFSPLHQGSEIPAFAGMTGKCRLSAMTPAPLRPLLAPSAWGAGEPEPAANKATRLEREISERAAALNAQVANELSQVEQRADREAREQLNSLNAAAAVNEA